MAGEQSSTQGDRVAAGDERELRVAAQADGGDDLHAREGGHAGGERAGADAARVAAPALAQERLDGRGVQAELGGGCRLAECHADLRVGEGDQLAAVDVIVTGGEVEVVGAAEVGRGSGDDGAALRGGEARVAEDGDALAEAAGLPSLPRSALDRLDGFDDLDRGAAAGDEADVSVGAGGGEDDRAGLGSARGVEDEVAVEEGGGGRRWLGRGRRTRRRGWRRGAGAARLESSGRRG